MNYFKVLATVILTIGMSSFLFSQEKGIQFEEYEVRIEWDMDSLDEVEAPVAMTDCASSELNTEVKDRLFSGGKHGTLERTYIATDACGNEAKTVQYIVLTKVKA